MTARRRAALAAAAIALLAGVGLPAGWATWTAGADDRQTLHQLETLRADPDPAARYATLTQAAPAGLAASSLLAHAAAAARSAGLSLAEHTATAATPTTTRWTLTFTSPSQDRAAAGAAAVSVVTALGGAPRAVDVTQVSVDASTVVVDLITYRLPAADRP